MKSRLVVSTVAMFMLLTACASSRQLASETTEPSPPPEPAESVIPTDSPLPPMPSADPEIPIPTTPAAPKHSPAQRRVKPPPAPGPGPPPAAPAPVPPPPAPAPVPPPPAPAPVPPPPAPVPPPPAGGIGAPIGTGGGAAVGSPIRLPRHYEYEGMEVTDVRPFLEGEIRSGCEDGSLCVGIALKAEPHDFQTLCTVARIDFPAEATELPDDHFSVPPGSTVTIVTGTRSCESDELDSPPSS